MSDLVYADREFFETIFGTAQGYAHFAVGRGATKNASGGYAHEAWDSRAFAWPSHAEQGMAFANSVVASPARDDLYVCPNLLETAARKKGSATTRRLLHADVDNGVELAKILELRGFAVNSGTPGHAHVFVPLTTDVSPERYDLLMKGMRTHLNGDHKIADNDLLRPPGSKNYKAVVLDGLDAPFVVDWLVKPPSGALDPEAVAALLGVTSLGSGDVAATGLEELTAPVNREQAQFDVALYPLVEHALSTESGDRSSDTQRIVRTGFDVGLQLSQIRWAVSLRADLQERLDGRDDDDVGRIFLKLADEAQSEKVGARPHESHDAFRAAVDKEIRTQKVREAARVEIARERRGGDAPFDAGLLQEILARPAEEPYRITGLLPSGGAMLVVAQRKTGKTTLTMNLARSLIDGELFLGKFPVRPVAGRVAVLNYEVSGAQFGMWAAQAGLPADRLYLVNLRGSRNPLTDREDRKRLAALLREQEVESLIVDPFGRAFGGASQNDSGEVGTWLVDLDKFARSEVGVADLILTTHAGWNGTRTRGSSSLEDWADSVILMTRDQKDEETRYLRAFGRDVYLEEDRLTFDQPTRTLTLTGSGSKNQNYKYAKASDLVVHVVAYVDGHPGASGADVLRAMHEKRDSGDLFAFQDNDVTQARRLAEKSGLLRSEPGGPGKPIRHYVIDPPPGFSKEPEPVDKEVK